jgi:hypothetical protein
MNEEYSYKDFLQKQLTDKPAEDFTGEIVGSCFAQDVPNTQVFPEIATCTFVRCCLNNCEIPDGCTVGEGSVNHQHWKQNDGEQWVLNEQGKPVSPVNHKQYLRYGLSEDPKDLPAEPRKVPILKQMLFERRKTKLVTQKQQELQDLIDKTEPDISTIEAP